MIQLLKNPAYLWSLIAIACVGMWATALFYEYGLGTEPCILCIHIRLWVTAVLGISLIGIALRNHIWAQIILWLAFLGSAVALIERSWVLLGTEKGWIISGCGASTDPGLPAWMPLDEWLPSLFRPETTCGLSPELLLGVTMAEGTMAASVVFTLIAVGGLATAVMAAMEEQDRARHQ